MIKTRLEEGVHTYLQMQLTGIPPEKRICIVHDQCTVFMRQALEREDLQRRPLLDKTQNLLVVLERALNVDDPTSKSLFYLYDYCYCLLEEQGNAAISKALSIITQLQSTFNELLTNR